MLLTSSAHKILLLVLTVASFAVSSFAQQSQLGKVEFPTSGSAQAQVHFLRGLAALHSFWYEEALDEFRQSTKADPDFMMGYWGEAMTYNHPLWGEQDIEAARKVLTKIHDFPKLSVRERAYLNAVRVLYGEGDKLTRDIAYSAALEKIHRDEPDDLEAACFYALSLLGTVRPGDKGFRRQMQAAAIALDVYQKNPNHPGAAHYIIHAFDDPEHAILALPAARRYAEIAPEAFHARHMPSHIFLQLGMWPEATASNESSWAASVAWAERKGLPLSARDYHSLYWLFYVYLQQGRYAKAEELLALKQKDMAAAGNDPAVRRYYAEMVAGLVFETQRWESAAKLVSALEAKGETQAAGYGAATGGHSGHDPTSNTAKTQASGLIAARPNRSTPNPPAFIRGLAAASTGALAEAEKSVAELRAVREQLEGAGQSYGAKQARIRELEVAAMTEAAKGNYTEAIALMKQATTLEEEMSPPSGPPEIIKPSHELFGEILLRAGRPQEAAQQFAISLQRQPNRARSLLGAARAAAQSGDKTGAATAYGDFLRMWQQADSQLPELREARDHLEQAKAR